MASIKIGKPKKKVYIVAPRLILPEDKNQDINGYQFTSELQASKFAKKARSMVAMAYRKAVGLDNSAKLAHGLDLEIIEQPVDKEGKPDGEASFSERLHGGSHTPSGRGVKKTDKAATESESDEEDDDEEEEDEEEEDDDEDDE